MPRRHKRTPLFVEVVDLGIVNGDLKGPVPAVLDGPAGVTGHSRHEAVVLFETADAEPQERARVSFDIWSQNAGGCTCRTLPASALINDAHLSTARRELVRDRIADYTGADDDDLHRTILVGRSVVGRLYRLRLEPELHPDFDAARLRGGCRSAEEG